MARNNGHAGPDRRDGLVPAHAPAIGCMGGPAGVAALTPLSVEGMIVAASTALLAGSRSGCRRDHRCRDHGILDIHRGSVRPLTEMAMATRHTARTVHHTVSEDGRPAPGAGNVRTQRATCGTRPGAISISTTA